MVGFMEDATDTVNGLEVEPTNSPALYEYRTAVAVAVVELGNAEYHVAGIVKLAEEVPAAMLSTVTFGALEQDKTSLYVCASLIFVHVAVPDEPMFVSVTVLSTPAATAQIAYRVTDSLAV